MFELAQEKKNSVPNEANTMASQPKSSQSHSLAPKLPSIEDFQFLKPISRGAFGKVFLGQKKGKPGTQKYAIKVMKKEDMINKNMVNQVIAERNALALSKSPCIVHLYYSLQSKQNVYLVMEYMIGGDVKSLLTMYGYFDEHMAVRYIAEVILALEYLHSHGIVHRDLKPDNMLISPTGHIKLTDFGLSRIDLDRQINIGDVINTPSVNRSYAEDYFRTPGQVLSLTSNLAFSSQKKPCSDSIGWATPQQNSGNRMRRMMQHVSGPTTPFITSGCKHSSKIHPPTIPPDPHLLSPQQHSAGPVALSPPVFSPTRSPPPTPAGASSSAMDLAAAPQTPANSKSLPSGRRTSCYTPPPIRSLTPTLQESLSWKRGSTSEQGSTTSFAMSLSHTQTRLESIADTDESVFADHAEKDSLKLPLKPVQNLLKMALMHGTGQEVSSVDSVDSGFARGIRSHNHSSRPGSRALKGKENIKDITPTSAFRVMQARALKMPLDACRDSVGYAGDVSDLENSVIAAPSLSSSLSTSHGQQMLNNSCESIELQRHQQNSPDYQVATKMAFSPDIIAAVANAYPPSPSLDGLNNNNNNATRAQFARKRTFHEVEKSPLFKKNLGQCGGIRGSSTGLTGEFQGFAIGDEHRRKRSNVTEDDLIEGAERRKELYDQALLESSIALSPGDYTPDVTAIETPPCDQNQNSKVFGKLEIESGGSVSSEKNGFCTPPNTLSPIEGPKVPCTTPCSDEVLQQTMVTPDLSYLRALAKRLHSSQSESDIKYASTSQSESEMKPNPTTSQSDSMLGRLSSQSDAEMLEMTKTSQSERGMDRLSSQSEMDTGGTGDKNSQSESDTCEVDRNSDHIETMGTDTKLEDSSLVNSEMSSFSKIVLRVDEMDGACASKRKNRVSSADDIESSEMEISVEDLDSSMCHMSVSDDSIQHSPPADTSQAAVTMDSPSSAAAVSSSSPSVVDGVVNKQLLRVKEGRTRRLSSSMYETRGCGAGAGAGGGGSHLPSSSCHTVGSNSSQGTMAPPRTSGIHDQKQLNETTPKQKRTVVNKVTRFMSLPTVVSSEDEHQLTPCTPRPGSRTAGGGFMTPGNARFGPHGTPFRTPKSVRRGRIAPEDQRILGTPDYLAPEILLQHDHGKPVDWWALGVCLFEFLTGIPPFNDDTVELVFQNILNRDIRFPEGEEALSASSMDAINELLKMQPWSRPSAQELKKHPLLSHIDWENLQHTDAPFVPCPDNDSDTSYFDARNELQHLQVSGIDL